MAYAMMFVLNKKRTQMKNTFYVATCWCGCWGNSAGSVSSEGAGLA
jgi:hypothetical protein